MVGVKVCGMNDPLNVREIVETNPDYLGYIFYKGSPRYVGEDPDHSLFQAVPGGIMKTGVFLNAGINTILNISLYAGLDVIQLHGNEAPEFCGQIKSSGLTTIKSFNIGKNFRFDLVFPYASVCDYFLFDSKSEMAGGSGQKFSWDILQEYKIDKPFFLSGGIGPGDAAIIGSIRNRGLAVVDINSRFETSPGIKNKALVKTFIDEIKNDER